MNTIRTLVTAYLATDTAVAALAQGGILAKPLVMAGEPGYQASAWFASADPQVGMPKPCATVSDVNESLEEDTIAGILGFISVKVYAPKHASGKLTARRLLEAVYDALHGAELLLEVEGEGYATFEWRNGTPVDDSLLIPTAVEATARYEASYVKRLV